MDTGSRKEKRQNACRYALASELFELDEFGNARGKSRDREPVELEDKAFTARANCPKGAIVIEGGGEA